MNIRAIHRLRANKPAGYPVFILSASLFVCGVFAGILFARSVPDSTLLQRSAVDFADSIFFETGESVVSFATVFQNIRFHLLIFFLGFSAFGLFFIPLVSAIFGFSLSFSISIVYCVIGGVPGIFSILSLFFFFLPVSLICFFLLVLQSADIAGRILFYSVGRSGADSGSIFTLHRFMRFSILILVVAICSVFNAYVSRFFLNLIFNNF